MEIYTEKDIFYSDEEEEKERSKIEDQMKIIEDLRSEIELLKQTHLKKVKILQNNVSIQSAEICALLHTAAHNRILIDNLRKAKICTNCSQERHGSS
jgi:hypothetical protein